MGELKTETLVVLGVALALIYMGKKAATAVTDTVKAVVPYVNPADDRNVINQAATDLWHAVSGSTGTIGGDIYDATHGGVLSNGTFNPTSDNNFIYKGVSDLFGGDLGSKIYDWTH